MTTKTKTKAKSYFVVSGNINGNQREPLLRTSAAQADVAITGTVLGALGELGYVEPDGKLKDGIIVEVAVASRKGSHCHTPYRAADFAGIVGQGEHVTTITLRNHRFVKNFAEWTVTKVSL